MIGGIRTCLGVSDDPMFLWISSNSCSRKFAACSKPPSKDEIIIVKRLIQGRNNATRVQVEPRLFDQGRYKNDTLPIWPRCRQILVVMNVHTALKEPFGKAPPPLIFPFRSSGSSASVHKQ